MKSKMIAIGMILMGLLVWTGGTAWARDNRGQRQRQEVNRYQNHDRQRQHRINKDYRAHKWDRHGHQKHFKCSRKHYRRHAPPAKHHYRRHYRPRYHHGAHQNHGHDGFRLGCSVWEPGMAFNFMVSGRD